MRYGVCTEAAGGCCLSSSFNKPSFSHPDILFQTVKMDVSAHNALQFTSYT